MDAIIDLSSFKNSKGLPREPDWPAADVIVGNPPFLGGNRIRQELGDQYVDSLFKLYDGRIPAFADLCCYWFEKARAMIESDKAKRVGLLATQGIRGGVNREVLKRIKVTGDIFWAFSDRNWIQDGVAVHVSMIGFDNGTEKIHILDHAYASNINADLTTTTDVTQAKRLEENFDISFQGPSPKGSFDIDANTARYMLAAPPNPNNRPNSDVVRPVISAIDIGQKQRNKWTIDFGMMSKEEAAKYIKPFEYVKERVYPVRVKNRRAAYAERWWQYAEPRPGMREALKGKSRYIATPRVSKHRLFVWLQPQVLANDGTIVFARDDDFFFGILNSRVHEVWARATGTQLREAESGFRYTPTSTFETFPFPHGTSKQKASIAFAAREMNELRENLLDPYKDQPSAIRVEIDQNSLTKLYNKPPETLLLAHRKLDEAVLDAYGWPHDISDEEILSKLLVLNLERAGKSS